MTETGPVDIAHPAHNPFDMPRARQSKGVTIAIIASIVVHLVIGLYLWRVKFNPHYRTFQDEKLDTQLIKPPPRPAPPPPPRPPPPRRKTSPRRRQSSRARRQRCR